MKYWAFAPLLLLALPLQAADDDLSGVSADVGQQAQSFCIFDKGPPAGMPVKVLRKIKEAKGSYGGVAEILPRLVNKAISLKADAIVDYNGAQRFGFFPWRLVRPVVTGTAVQWQTPPGRSCEQLGGTTLQTILATNKPPTDTPATAAEAASAASAP